MVCLFLQKWPAQYAAATPNYLSTKEKIRLTLDEMAPAAKPRILTAR